MAQLPHLSVARRASMAELPPLPEEHAKLLAGLPFLDEVESVAPPAPPRAAPEDARLVVWNAERGRHLDAAAALLGAEDADAYLLSELDCGMARTDQHHTAAELARRLGCGYVYGIEFVELGLGDAREQRECAGAENAIGYHGGAILSPHALAAVRLARLDRSGRWFDGELGERRVGGRMAVLASLELAGGPLALASVHLESHSDPEHRCEQLRGVLDAVEDLRPGGAAVVAGDLNTSSLAVSHLREPDRLKRALLDDPERLARPQPHEPLFRLAEERGYDWRTCNAVDVSTQRRKDASPSGETRRGTLHLDWVLCRGVEASDARVLAAVDPASGRVLSDHEALTVRVRLT